MKNIFILSILCPLWIFADSWGISIGIGGNDGFVGASYSHGYSRHYYNTPYPSYRVYHPPVYVAPYYSGYPYPFPLQYSPSSYFYGGYFHRNYNNGLRRYSRETHKQPQHYHQSRVPRSRQSPTPNHSHSRRGQSPSRTSSGNWNRDPRPRR